MTTHASLPPRLLNVFVPAGYVASLDVLNEAFFVDRSFVQLKFVAWFSSHCEPAKQYRPIQAF